MHEQCHGFTHDNQWHAENIYLGNGTFLNISITSVFDSAEMNDSIPEALRTGRFDQYLGENASPYMTSRQHGAYGLLDEFTAYCWGMDTYVKLYDYYKGTDAVRWGNDTYVSYAEFRYYILHYMLYARDNHPEVYQGILKNDAFRQAFSAIDERFGALISEWRASGHGNLYFEDRYQSLMTELQKPEYQQMAVLLRP